MKDARNSRMFKQQKDLTDRKLWNPPKIVDIDIRQTESGGTGGADGPGTQAPS